MKKIVTILFATGFALLSSVSLRAQLVEITPSKIFERVTQYFNTDSSYSNYTSSVSTHFQYDKTTNNKVTVRNQSASVGSNWPVSGYTYGLGRFNANDEIFYAEDSMCYKATGNYGPTIQFANSGTRRVVYDWGVQNLYTEGADPNDWRFGVILHMICGTDTVLDTLFTHPKVKTRKSSVYTVTGSGSKTVQFKIIKRGAGYNGGNTNFFGMRVYDASVGGYLLNTPCEPLLGGSIVKIPSKSAYDIDDVVELTATAKEGYRFSKWSDGETEPTRNVVVQNADINLSAIFIPIDYALTVVSDPVQGGIITKVPEKQYYNVGDVITISATASSTSYRFLNWSDGITTTTRTYTMPAGNIMLTAEFLNLIPRALNIAASPTYGGDIIATPRVVPTTPGIYFDRDIIDLVATPRVGYEFVRWSDGTEDPEYTIRVDGDVNLTAEFRLATGSTVEVDYPKPQIKVDFDLADENRKDKEVNEPGYISWRLNAATYSKSFDDVTVTMHAAGGLKTSWYKLGIQAPYFARLASDGVMADEIVVNGTVTAEISMTISGLRKGEHTLQLYFNAWDSPSAYTFGSVDIYVNGAFNQNVPQTCRSLLNDTVGIAYVTFTARDYEDVVIRMACNTSNNPNLKNVFLCGFELNTPSIKRQARRPYPAHLDEHANGDNGSIVLKWEDPLGGAADTYDVYVGTDSAAVALADKSNTGIFKGTSANKSYTLTDVYNMNTYYWRVDATKNGVTTRGSDWFFRPRVLAFPGAEGYGKYARGARGGKVVYVTNLNDDGPGSFREAIRNDIGPRYVLFAVGGRIDLVPTERVTLNSNYVTVAGQTAPGKGICIAGSAFGISGAKDAIVRFMRVRVGQLGTTIDAMGMNDANYSIMDHNSMSWSHDESFSSRSGKNFTLQNTIIAEALGYACHKNYGCGTNHGYAATIGGDTASFLRNLLAHCNGRNWSLGGGLTGNGDYAGHLDITNNIVYNYGSRVTDGGAHEVNFVNNYYKKGPSGNATSGMLKAQHEGVGTGTQKYYYAGNVNENADGSFACTGGTEASGANSLLCGYSDQWSGGETSYKATVDAPFFPSHATVLTAYHAFKNVMSDCGANMPMLDEHDRRNILESRDGTSTYRGSRSNLAGQIDHHLDVGGWEDYPTVVRPSDYDSDLDGLPDWWEKEVSGTNPHGAIGDFTDTNADPQRDGVTNIEEFLEFMSNPNFTTQKNRQVAIELSQYTLGYTKSPVYTQESVNNGTLTFDANWVRFQPDLDYTGVTYFYFKVTDTDGDSMVRKIGVRVTE